VCGVLFFGLCGLVVLLVPFLDRGGKTRMVLNALAALAVAFFIFMTAWSWFSGTGQGALRIMLGSLLVAVVLFLLIPFARAQTTARWVVYACLAITVIAFLSASGWELTR
jgi:quinol-cytochrome oxidoreductase complex cytochrome b subunit